MTTLQLLYSDPHTQLIYIIDAATQSRTWTGFAGLSPAWLQDSGRFIYIGTPGGQHEIGIATMSPWNYQKIAGARGAIMPQMGQNGLICFMGEPSSTQASGASIYTMGPTGNIIAELVPGGIQPSMSIAGDRVYYCRQTVPYDRQLASIGTDGSGFQQLTQDRGDPNTKNSNAPDVSYNGLMLAHFTGREAPEGSAGGNTGPFNLGPRNVGSMSASGGTITVLTRCVNVKDMHDMAALGPNGCFAADNPHWLPDGSGFICDQGGPESGTWLYNADGTDGRWLLPYVLGPTARPCRFV